MNKTEKIEPLELQFDLRAIFPAPDPINHRNSQKRWLLLKNRNCSWKLQKNELNLHPSTRQGRPPGRRRSWPELFLRRVVPSDNYGPRRPLHFQMLDFGEWIWLHLDPSFLKMKVRVFQWSMENYRSGIQKRSLLWSTTLFLLPPSFANRKWFKCWTANTMN